MSYKRAIVEKENPFPRQCKGDKINCDAPKSNEKVSIRCAKWYRSSSFSFSAVTLMIKPIVLDHRDKTSRREAVYFQEGLPSHVSESVRPATLTDIENSAQSRQSRAPTSRQLGSALRPANFQRPNTSVYYVLLTRTIQP